LPDGERNLHQGQPVILTTGVRQNMDDIPVDFPGLPATVHTGELILLDDGNIELRVEEIETDRVKARVVVGGLLKSHKGISIPHADLNLPSLTSKDLKDLKFGLELGVDAVAISFIRTEKDILFLRETCALSPAVPASRSSPSQRPSAFKHLDDISGRQAMVARGDLVWRCLHRCPIAQKRIINPQRCARRITTNPDVQSMILAVPEQKHPM
jgi:pyruvate kinase